MRRAACLLFCLAAFGEELPVRIYTTADGLAGNTIDRMARDSRGYLWFCTREGISRFDGYQFRNFGADQGLPAPDNDLVETPSGDYFIATGDGIARFRPADANSHFTVLRLNGPPRPVACGWALPPGFIISTRLIGCGPWTSGWRTRLSRMAPSKRCWWTALALYGSAREAASTVDFPTGKVKAPAADYRTRMLPPCCKTARGGCGPEHGKACAVSCLIAAWLEGRRRTHARQCPD